MLDIICDGLKQGFGVWEFQMESGVQSQFWDEVEELWKWIGDSWCPKNNWNDNIANCIEQKDDLNG